MPRSHISVKMSANIFPTVCITNTNNTASCSCVPSAVPSCGQGFDGWAICGSTASNERGKQNTPALVPLAGHIPSHTRLCGRGQFLLHMQSIYQNMPRIEAFYPKYPHFRGDLTKSGPLCSPGDSQIRGGSRKTSKAPIRCPRSGVSKWKQCTGRAPSRALQADRTTSKPDLPRAHTLRANIVQLVQIHTLCVKFY